ncbi:ketoacyl-ACP synthase III family protein [Sphaerisporangium flaviroseum]|uniref:ketoacyl-ACP synthase III family protein n=1 Tax=Sphaerisporangium flaviroseum TaxID=509199 RepID=UPI0031EB82A1
MNASAAWIGQREDVQKAVAEGRYDAAEYQEDGYIALPVAGPDDSPADMAVSAGQVAVERAGVPGGDFTIVLCATTSFQGLDHWSPAPYIQHRTVGSGAQSVEVRQACNGGMAALELAAAYLSVGSLSAAALLTTTDKFALPQFDRFRSDKGMARGDGATALVLSRRPGVARLLSTASIGDPKHEGTGRGDAKWADASGEQGWPVDLRSRREQYTDRMGDIKTIMTDLAVRQHESVQLALADAKVDFADINWFVFPNVSQGVAKIRNQAFGIDEGRTTTRWGLETGHIGAGDQFGGLTYLLETHQVSVGDRVLLSGAGGGWNFTAAVVEITEVPDWPSTAA